MSRSTCTDRTRAAVHHPPAVVRDDRVAITSALIFSVRSFTDLFATLADTSHIARPANRARFAAVALGFSRWWPDGSGCFRGCPAREPIAVSLGCGLLVLAAWWAAIGSAGRSSFTPVAVGFAASIEASVLRPQGDQATLGIRVRISIPILLGACAFVVTVGLLMDSAMAPSPRDGVQPLPFQDPAFYAVLGRTLVRPCRQYPAPSGFSAIPGMPAQAWYHWGEISSPRPFRGWSGPRPLPPAISSCCRCFSSPRRMGRHDRAASDPTTRSTFLLSFSACLFLAPLPWVATPSSASHPSSPGSPWECSTESTPTGSPPSPCR